MDLETNEILPLFDPRVQAWSEHFVWRGLEIQGRTAVGRATAELLRLNTPDRLRVRELVCRVGYALRD